MSVVIETTLGDFTVDLFLDERPRACRNFLKLCKIKYYNYNLFHTISRGFIAQTGDPTGCRTGGESIFGVIEGSDKRYFEGENKPRIKHTKMGLISFVGNEERMIGSQFFITLGEDLTYLDEKHCVFGEVVEGLDILDVINEVICDTDDRPYQDVRITHTVVLDDPYPDPEHLPVPSRSPSPSAERLQGGRIAPDEEIDETEGKTVQEVAEIRAEREAKARATILEMIGDIPDAEIAPPENVLFVCKLNPVTTDEDLEIIFNRFGKIKSCEVIRDRKSGDSLQYAFIEFEEKKSCEDAYFKMDNILIDDRRIHVDFSQSVSKVKWLGKGRVAHFDDQGKKISDGDVNIGKGNYKLKGGQIEQYRNNRTAENEKKQRPTSPRDNRNKKFQSPERKNKEYRDRRRSRSPRDNRKESNRSSISRSPRRSYRNSPKRYENDKRRERFVEQYKRKASEENSGDYRSAGRDRRNDYRDKRRSRSRSPSQRSRNVSPRRERYKEHGNSQRTARSPPREYVRKKDDKYREEAKSGPREYIRKNEVDKYEREHSSKSRNSKSVEKTSGKKTERRSSPESEDRPKKTSKRSKEKISESTSEESDDSSRKKRTQRKKKNRKHDSSSSDSSSESEEKARSGSREYIRRKEDDKYRDKHSSKSRDSKSVEKRRQRRPSSESGDKLKKTSKKHKKKSESTSEEESDDSVKKKKSSHKKNKKRDSSSSDSSSESEEEAEIKILLKKKKRRDSDNSKKHKKLKKRNKRKSSTSESESSSGDEVKRKKKKKRCDSEEDETIRKKRKMKKKKRESDSD